MKVIRLVEVTNFTELDSPPLVQLVKKFPTLYGTRRFVTVFTRALHW
jgi:hypothetical protein